MSRCLGDLQHSFQQHVLRGDAAIVAQIDEARRVSAATRLDVYSEAYRLRLRDALASTYPRLQQLLGAEEFDALAWKYVAGHPSHRPSIRWFGHELGAALRGLRDREPWLSELADWEWALAAAFDAADAAPLAIDALSPVTPDEWPGLRLVFHPSLQRLQLHTNAGTLFKQLSEETPAGEPALLGEPQSWVLWRQVLTTRYRSLDVSEASALDAMVDGCNFAELCDLLCSWHAQEDVPLRAASTLKGWLADGLIVAAALSDSP